MGQWHSKVRFHNLDEGQPWLEHCHWHSPALHWPKEEEEKEETSSQNKQCHPQLRLKNPSVRTGNRLTSANLHWWIQMIPSTSKWNLWMKLRNRKQETKSTMPWVQRRPRAHRDNWVLTWIHKCKLHGSDLFVPCVKCQIQHLKLNCSSPLICGVTKSIAKFILWGEIICGESWSWTIHILSKHKFQLRQWFFVCTRFCICDDVGKPFTWVFLVIQYQNGW